ncbi:MAG: hypothetical protein WC383_15505, partial [Gammaproteobacteria bacterium]
RISIIPTVNGESVVIRILDREIGVKPLDRLGLTDQQLAEFKATDQPVFRHDPGDGAHRFGQVHNTLCAAQ